MLSINRALAFIFTGGVPIYGLEEGVTKIAEAQWCGLPFPAIAMLSMALVAYLLLSRTQFGAQTLLLGDNPAAGHGSE